MLKTRVFASDCLLFQNEGLLVAPKLRIYLTNYRCVMSFSKSESDFSESSSFL